MNEVKIETIEKSSEKILEKVGKETFVNWDTFSQSSTDVARSIDELNSSLAVFREIQHKNFIQTSNYHNNIVKKLKGLDIPDLIQSVNAKKLPREALRGVLSRFKLEGENIELIESAEELKAKASKKFNEYYQKNLEFVEALNSYTAFINKKIEESGLSTVQAKLQNKESENKIIKSTVKFNLNEEQTSKIASAIKIQYLAGTQLISFETYSQIVEGTYKIIKDEYEKLTKEARVNQRQNIGDKKEYLKIINEYLVNSEALVNEGQALLSRKVGVPEDKLGESEIALMERGLGNNLLMIQSHLRAQLKESLIPEQNVSIEIAKEIIKYQVELIQTKSNEINEIISGIEKGPEALQIIPMILTLILNDYVFEKFGYEEEDFMKNLGQNFITSNPEFVQIFRSMEMGIMKLMQSLDVVPPEVAQMMKQQQIFMEQMGAQGISPEMMMPPGITPQGLGLPGQSSNPMDMLQMQQLEQMQQMFAQMGIQPPK